MHGGGGGGRGGEGGGGHSSIVYESVWECNPHKAQDFLQCYLFLGSGAARLAMLRLYKIKIYDDKMLKLTMLQLFPNCFYQQK